MTSPGGAEVGRASVRVWPDTTGFKQELEAKLAAIDVKMQVDVEPKLDTAVLRAQLAALDLKDIDMHIDIDGLTEAYVDLAEFELIVNRLDGRNININLKVDGLLTAMAQITVLSRMINDLSGRIRILNGASGGAGGAGGALGGGGGLGLRSLFRIIRGVAIVGGVSVLLVYAGAALTAAWGILSTTIAAVPAALSLVALPIGAIILGLDGIKKAAETLNPEIEKLQKNVSDTFEKGFTKAFNMIRPIFGSILTPGFVGIAKAINDIALALARLISSTDGATLLTNIFTGVQTSLRNITPGILDIVDALLIMAGRKSALDALVATVNAFGNAWRTQLVDNITNGTLDAAFRNLGALLVSLSEGIAAFIHNGIEVFATAGPEITHFFDSLTGFFNKFDWERLGVAVGNVFKGLADALDRIDPATIEAITKSFEDMGKAFSDKQFVDDLVAIIEALPRLLGILTQIAVGFVRVVTVITDVLIFMDDFGNHVNKSLDEAGAAVKRFFDIFPTINFPIVGAGLTSKFDGFIGSIVTAFTTGAPKVEKAAGFLTHNVPTIVSQSLSTIPSDTGKALSGVAGAVQTGLAPIPPTAQAIFTQLQPVMQGALAGLATTAQLGFASVAAAVAAGGPAMIAAITQAFVGTDVAISTAFGLMATKATESLGILATAIVIGFATIVEPAFVTGFNNITFRFATFGVEMAAAITQGLQQVYDAAFIKVEEIGDLFLRAQTSWIATVIVAGGLMATYLTTGLNEVNVAVVAGLNVIMASFETWRTNVVTVGEFAMQEFNTALTQGLITASETVITLTAEMVETLNLAVADFRAAGSNMGAALAEGLRSRQGEVEAAAAALANAAAAAVRAAAVIRSPSKVFSYLGKMVGKGFILGIGLTLAETARVATKLVDITSGALSQIVDTDWGSQIGESISAVDARTSMFASGSNVSIDSNSLGSTVADALAGWTVEIDQAGIAKLVNKENLRNRRR